MLFEEVIQEIRPSNRLLEASSVVLELRTKHHLDEEEKEKLKDAEREVKAEEKSQEYRQAVEIIDGVVRGMRVWRINHVRLTGFRNGLKINTF